MRNPHFDRNIHPVNMPKSILYAAKNTTSEGKKNTPMTGFPSPPSEHKIKRKKGLPFDTRAVLV
ncbi:hypothetical protein HMPREF1554_02328 [Porphyromonas gingivalis F0569]|nr:hypothetical protein HMPREF1554_02328 [Porphyromonas gingivalis F0569]